MPTMPARLASTAERWFGHPALVDDVQVLSPGLRRVTFVGAPAIGSRWTPGEEVEFRVSPTAFRHYTPTAMDLHAGRFDVIFHDHGSRDRAGGPGAAWARALRRNGEVSVMGPGGGVRRRHGGHELFLGDATTLGLFAALAPTAESFSGAVEVPEADVEAAAALVPGLEVLVAEPVPGAALRQWLAHRLPAVAPGTSGPVRPDRACLAGHGQTIQQLRNRLRLAGIPRPAITAKAHWSTGKRGL